MLEDIERRYLLKALEMTGGAKKKSRRATGYDLSLIPVSSGQDWRGQRG
jgi:hypothetical protein